MRRVSALLAIASAFRSWVAIQRSTMARSTPSSVCNSDCKLAFIVDSIAR